MLFNWVADRKPIYMLGAGDRPFQALGVDDLVDACLLALDGSPKNESYNLGASRYGSFRSDVEALVRYAGTGASVVPLPAAPARAALWLLDTLDLSPLTAWHYRTADAEFHFDCSKAHTRLGWRPTLSNTEMLCAAYEWYVAHRVRVDRDPGVTHTKSLPQRALRLIKALS
jgi:nucleoside-diphosphate-sugar epimerase